MFPETHRTAEADCPICYEIHDEEIHAATLRLHGWFRHQVTHLLEEEFDEAAAAAYVETQVA